MCQLGSWNHLDHCTALWRPQCNVKSSTLILSVKIIFRSELNALKCRVIRVVLCQVVDGELTNPLYVHYYVRRTPLLNPTDDLLVLVFNVSFE